MRTNTNVSQDLIEQINFIKCTNDPVAMLWQFIVALLLHTSKPQVITSKRTKCIAFKWSPNPFKQRHTFVHSLIVIIDCAMCDVDVDFDLCATHTLVRASENGWEKSSLKCRPTPKAKTKRHQHPLVICGDETAKNRLCPKIEIKSYCIQTIVIFLHRVFYVTIIEMEEVLTEITFWTEL